MEVVYLLEQDCLRCGDDAAARYLKAVGLQRGNSEKNREQDDKCEEQFLEHSAPYLQFGIGPGY